MVTGVVADLVYLREKAAALRELALHDDADHARITAKLLEVAAALDAVVKQYNPINNAGPHQGATPAKPPRPRIRVVPS